MNKLRLFFNGFTPLCGMAAFTAATVRGIDIHAVTGKVDLNLIPLGIIGLAIAVPYQVALVVRGHKKDAKLDSHAETQGL